MGVGGSILSPGVDSVETACAWKDDESNGGEDVSWGRGGDEEMEKEGDSKAKDWQEGEEEQSGHDQRQFYLLNGEEGRVTSAAPEDARCSSSSLDRGPATR